MTKQRTTQQVSEAIARLLALFKLPTLAGELVRRLTDAGHDDVLPVLLEVLELEQQDRHERRVDRLRRASKLPPGKTMGTFDDKRLARPAVTKIRELAKGEFLDGAVNVLAFGLPGTGKTHACCALGHVLVEAGLSVFFTPAYMLVQDLLAAKREFELPRALRKLDNFDVVIIDDIGYVQQDREEMEVLFTFLAERYERKSVMITSNLVFSEWEQIFKNPMTTAAAIDRLVHHSVILEFDVPSYRTDGANKKAADNNTKPAAKSSSRKKGGPSKVAQTA